MELNEQQHEWMKHKARTCRGKIVSFRPDPAAESRWVGKCESAKLAGRHQPTGIPDLQLRIRGRSGKEMTISLVEHYARIFPDWEEAFLWAL